MAAPVPRRDRSDRLGVLGIEALMGAHDAEQAKLNELMAVTSAVSTILNARRADLVAEEKRARRRKAAARGLLTRAQKDGSAARIVARLPPTVGSIEQWVGSTDVLSSPGRRAALQAACRTWADAG